MIALMGAAGHVGGRVAELLIGRKERIRVLQHRRGLDDLARAGAECVSGDARDAASLAGLFAGAQAALVLLPEELSDPEFVASRTRMARNIADALAAARVPYVVVLSAVGADHADAAGPPAGLHALERAVSGLPRANVLILRSAFYMDYLLANVPLMRAQHINGSAIGGDVPLPMIATSDVAEEAAERLVHRDFTGVQAKLLFGPEDVSMRDATMAIGVRLGMPELPYVQFPPEQLTTALTGAGMSHEAATQLVEMQLALNEGRPFGSVPRAAGTTTSTTLAAFLARALDMSPTSASTGGRS